MATVHPSKPKLTEKLSWYTSRGQHHMWDRFSADQQEKMLSDDLQAGTRVSILLTALIGIGLTMSIITLAIVLMQ